MNCIMIAVYGLLMGWFGYFYGLSRGLKENKYENQEEFLRQIKELFEDEDEGIDCGEY